VRIARSVDGRSPAPVPLHYDERAGALVQWLPLDLALPLLCVTPDVLVRHLRALGIDVGDGPYEPVRSSYAPGRRATLRLGDHVLRGFADEEAFERSLAGWQIATNGTLGPARVASWADLFRRSGARRRPAAPGPRPTTAVFEGAVPELRATVQLVLDGTSPGSSIQAASSAGALLSRIHALPAGGLPARSAGDTLEAARAAGEILQAVDPAAEKRVRSLLDRLAQRIPADADVVTSHGDFHRGELVRLGGELAVLDVHEACRAAPARDIATYVAHAAAREDADPAPVLDALLAGYRRRPDGLEFYLSAVLLRRAERPFHRLEEDWPARVEELVGAAERALGD
jgi:hypothetical protein